MQPLLIHVQCYAGYKADETPRRFRIENIWLEVDALIERWREVGCRPDRPRSDCFRVKACDGRYYLLRHELGADRWYLVRW